MVDQEIKSLGWTFTIDLIIFIFYVMVFFAIRGKRDQDTVLPNWKGAKRDLREHRFSDKDLRLS